MTFSTSVVNRRLPRLLFVCGREPRYVRNRLLLRGLSEHYPVSVIASNRARYPGRFVSLFPRLVRAASRADLIVAGFLGQPIALVAARVLRKPVLLDAFISVYDTLCLDRRTVDPTSVPGRVAFALDREAIGASSLTLVDTASQQRFFADTFRQTADRLWVHYLGPDLSLCADSPPRCDDAPTVVLHYGSYLPLHGVDVIVRAADLLRDDPTIRFRLIGTGPCRAQVQQLASALNLSNVEFVDWLSLADLAREIGSASIGLGGHFADNPKARRVVAGKTFQFLASGVPTIVGDCPANREIFDPGSHLETVPLADPLALAEAIRGLARDPSRRQRLGEAGAALMRDLFAPARVASTLRSAVECALDRAPGR